VQEFVRSSITSLDEAQYETKNEFLGIAAPSGASVPASPAASAASSEDDARLAAERAAQVQRQQEKEAKEKRAALERRGTASATKLIDFVDATAVSEMLVSLRDGSDDIDWIVFGYTADKKSLAVVAKGSDGRSSAAQALQDNAVMYVVVKNPGSGQRCTLCKWMGKQVKPLDRASTGTHLAAVQEFVRSSITSLDEAQYETKNEFLGLSHAAEVCVVSAAHSVDDAEQLRLQAIVQSGNTGFTSKSQVSSAGFSVRRASLSSTQPAASFPDESAVVDLLQSIKDDVADVNTVILGYAAHSSASLSLIGSHMCHWNELPQFLPSDMILCVFHRKNMIINWLGASVSPLKRAKASTTFGSVVDIFSVSLFADAVELLLCLILSCSASFPITVLYMLKRLKTSRSTQLTMLLQSFLGSHLRSTRIQIM
jgi:hypothetical protein